jgi:hypothetical protein
MVLHGGGCAIQPMNEMGNPCSIKAIPKTARQKLNLRLPFIDPLDTFLDAS